MTSYLLHQPPFSGFGVVCVACEQRHLLFSVLPWEGCQAVINLCRVRAGGPSLVHTMGGGAQLGPGVTRTCWSSFLLQTELHLCSCSSHCLGWVKKEREDLSCFSDGGFFICLQDCCAFPHECVQMG